MKQNQNHPALKRYAISTVALIAVVAVTFSIAALKRYVTDAAPAPKLAMGAAVPSEFSFTAAIGWWQGATNETSMALFHNPHDCFVSAQYNTGTIAISAALEQYQEGLTTSGYTITPRNTQALTLQTTAGKQPYQLQQYSVSGVGSMGAPEGGQELGYLQLTGGYVKIEGHCDTTSELPATIPALRAIRFNAAE